MKIASYLSLPFLALASSFALAQTTPDMATGLSPYATYIPSEIDNINPANGNIFVKIPILGYPQKGGKLRLNYYIYYNDKQWQSNLSLITPTNGGSPYVSGQWTPSGIAPITAPPVPTPSGVYIAKDQFLGFGTNYNQTKVQNVGGLGGNAIIESTSYLTKYVFTTDGAMHYVGDGVNQVVSCGPLVGGGACPSVPSWGNDNISLNSYPATDGSGYDQNGHDPEGNKYTGTSVTDPNGNSITWSSTGWTDTFGRFIPGGTSGAGASEFPNASGGYAASNAFFDLVPGTSLSSVPSECPSGTSAARSWTVPASASYGGSATYYLCYTYQNVQTAFNLNANIMSIGYTVSNVPEVSSSSGIGQALLLTAIVLPDGNKYTFQYDQYLSLTQLGLPSGGTISYTWQNIVFRPKPNMVGNWGGISTPISRALASRTVNPGDGQPAITTTYHWNITTSSSCTASNCSQGVSFPAYEVITDANGNDTEYTLGGTDDYGTMWADYLVTGVANYTGCSPHHLSCSGGTGTRLKSATYGLTAITSGGAPSISPAFVPVPGTLPPSKVTQTTNHVPTSGGDKISRVTSALAPADGTCTVYSYPLYQDGGNPQFPSTSYSQCYSTGQIASTATYDLGAAGSGSVGPLLKTDSLTYAWQGSSSVLTANMLDLVSTDTITDGSGAWAAETDKCYDADGNNTSVQRFPTQPSSRSCTTSPPSNALVTSATYSQGVITSTKDARGNTTTMSNFACNGAFPQTITLPDQNQVKYQYDCNTGKVTSVQDQNDITNSVATTYTYDDPLNRVTAANYPDGGSITVNYNGDNLPLTMTVTKATGEAAGPNVTTKTYDGLARIIHSQTSDGLPNVSDTIHVDTNYDSLGRTYTVSNPYRLTSDPTYGLTKTLYDAIGRTQTVIHPDGTSQTFSYNGNVVTFTDESGNQWQKTSDALGRLTNVMEPSSTSQSPTLPTNYVFDALGNLKSVNQVGLSGTDSARNRSFAYDALSRLLAANNPEKASGTSGPTQTCSGVSGTWTNCYSYDGNGNVTQETDNRGISIQYAFDTMNRLYSKAYFKAGVSTGEASSCYQYNTPISTASDKYPKGYLTLEWTQTGACPGPSNPQTSIPSGAITSTVILQHDPMGRLAQEQVCPLGPCSTAYLFNYTYDLAGNVTSSNNGLPASTSSTTMPAISWGETYDAANRMSLVFLTGQPWSDSAHPSVLLQANQNTYSTFGNAMPYDPFGHLVNEQLGLTTSSSPSVSAITSQRAYNNMGRILTEADVQNVPQSQSSNSTGQIVISGTEAGPFTTQPTSGSTVMSVTGSDGSNLVCQQQCNQYTCWTTCNSVPDTGTLSVTIDGFTSSASYGGGSTDATLAQTLSQGFGASNSPLTTAYGGSNAFSLTAKATGTASNYPITISNGDFTVSDPNQALTGGTNGGTVYDAGSITATIINNSVSPAVNYSATVNWGQGDTPSSIATHLASAISSVPGVPVTATPSGGTINLTSKGTGYGTNYAVAVSSADAETSTYPSLFPSPSFGATSTNMAIPIYSYQVPAGGYTANGNIAAINDSVNGNWTYKYDPLNRLQTANASTGTYANQYGCWSYDSFGNRTAESFGGTSCPSLETSVAATASYNGNNQFSGTAGNSAKFQYDNAGDVATDPLNTYLYDGEGRLCAVKNSNQSVYQYVYDAEGRRVVKATLTSWPSACFVPSSAPGFSATALYLRGSSGMQVTELTGTRAWAHTNFFGGPAPMVTYASSGWAFSFHFTDYLGSRRALTDAQGNVLETCQNLPFGNGETCAPDPTEHLFSGKERDVESGNDYFEARYYASTSGRFMSPDWSAKVAPVPYATMDDPQSLNLYAYVRNNPITGLDPDGHMSNADFSQMFMMGLAAQSGAWMEQQAEQAAQAQQEEAYENALAAFFTSFFFPSGDGGDPKPAAGAPGTAQQQQYLNNLASQLCLAPKDDNTPGDFGATREIDYHLVLASDQTTPYNATDPGKALYVNELQTNTSFATVPNNAEVLQGGPNAGLYSSTSRTPNGFDDSLGAGNATTPIASTQRFIVSGAPGLYPAISAPVNVCYGGQMYGSLGVYIMPGNGPVFVNGNTKMPGSVGSSQ